MLGSCLPGHAPSDVVDRCFRTGHTHKPSPNSVLGTTVRRKNQIAECTYFEIPPTFPFDVAEEMRHYNLNRYLINASWNLSHKSMNDALHLYETKTYKLKATQSKKKKLAKHVTISFYMPVNKAGPRKPNNWMGKYDRRLKIE